MPTALVHLSQPALQALAHPVVAASALDPECEDPDPQAAAVTATAARSSIARRCRRVTAAMRFVGGALAPIRS
jgi:hypothetical protein